MKYEYRIIDKEKGLVQVTTTDERFYGKIMLIDGKEVFNWKPSITFITASYPKGRGYEKWLGDKGWDKAEEIKNSAGDRGTIVHHAFQALIEDGEIKIDQKFKDRDGVERELTADEYYCVITGGQWYVSVGKPKPILIEKTVESEEYGYAGTLDYLFQFPDYTLLLDLKTSKAVYTSHELQLTVLEQACTENGYKVDKRAILQVGYTANKNQHWKFTETDADLPLFLATKQIWAKEYGGQRPLQRDYPLVINIK